MESRETPNIVWEPLDIPEAVGREFIKRGETLPREYEEALEDLRENIPESFMQQAEDASYYFWSLDTGKKLLDKNGQSLDEKVRGLADKVSDSGFVRGTYMRARMALFGERTNPQEALPWWITERVDSDNKVPLTDEEKDRLMSFYTRYAEANGSQNGEHYVYDERTFETDDFYNNFKLYLEHDALRNPQAIEKSLELLKEKGIHPNQSKLYEGDRLVFYWLRKPDEGITKQLLETFRSNGVEPRGPGQDTVRVEIKGDGEVNYKTTHSNDSGLGEGGSNPFLWKENTYDRKQFFKQYLRLTFFAAKNPSNPYLLSFIPILTEEGVNQQRKKVIVSKVEEQSGLSTHITETPFITAFEN